MALQLIPRWDLGLESSTVPVCLFTVSEQLGEKVNILGLTWLDIEQERPVNFLVLPIVLSNSAN